MTLEDLEKKLYQEKEISFKKESAEKKSLKTQGISSRWSDKKESIKNIRLEEPINRLSVFLKRFFWVIIVLVLIATVLLAFYLHQFFASRDIVFKVEAPREVQIGVPFSLKIYFENTSKSKLRQAKISIDLPENTTVKGGEPTKKILSEELGDLDLNSSFEKEFSFIVLNDEKTTKRFNVSLSYSPPNIKNRFEKIRNIDIAVKEPAIRLDLTTPTKVLNSEEFEININYENISEIDFSNVELELNYPKNFTFKDASASSTYGNNLWVLGDLKKGAKDNLVITGTIYGPEESFFAIEGIISVVIDGQKYIINKKTSNINIAPSPLNLSFSVNDKSFYVASLNEELRYELTYKNNADIALKDVVLKVNLRGAMFDFNSLKTQGSFNSKDNSITWTASDVSDFNSLGPGASGKVDFTIKTKSFYPIKKIGDKNFVLKAHAEITSPTTPYYVSAEKTIGLADFDIKISGLVQIDAQALFKDSQSGFINKGSWPMKVDQPTNFTIHWIIKNYSTDIRNVEVKANLAGGVNWVDKVKSNVSSVPTYNERTREISWLIDEIPATKGVISKPVEAIFQIEAVPNITQRGNYMPLLTETTIKAVDVFNNIELTNKDDGLTSDLIDDQYINRSDGRVQ